MICPALVLLLLPLVVCQAADDAFFYGAITSNVNPVSAPTAVGGGPVNVQVGLFLINTVKIDFETNEVDIITWMFMRWRDPRLSWASLDSINVTEVKIPPKDIWIPDLAVYSAASEMKHLAPEHAVVMRNGDVLFMPSYRYRVLCDASRSRINCTLPIGSWVYNANQVDLTLYGQGIDTSNYFEGSKYQVVDTSAVKQNKMYPCCEEPYPVINFSFTLRRGRRYRW